MANPRTIARIEARILERAAYCLQFEVNDPRATFITLTRVKLSTDLTSAKIYYSVLGAAADKSKVAHMLDHAGGFIQRQVARVLELRRVPRLSWIYDDSAEQAADLAKLIREARERDMEINPALRDEAPLAPAQGELDTDDPSDDEFGVPSDTDADGLDDEFDADEGDADDEPADDEAAPETRGPSRKS